MKIRNAFALFFLTPVVSFIPAIASADPVGVNIDIFCPNVSDHANMLANYGDYIAGYGKEKIESQDLIPIYFKSKSSVQGVPVELEHYNNSDVKYSSATGTITCSYASMLGEPSFSIAYTLTNGKGGIVTQQNNNYIHVIIPFGL